MKPPRKTHEWEGNACTRCQCRRNKTHTQYMTLDEWKFHKVCPPCIPRYRKKSIREEMWDDPEFQQKVRDLLLGTPAPEYHI